MTTDPAVQPFVNAYVPSTSYNEGNDHLSRPIEGDREMSSLSFVPSYEQYSHDATQSFEPMETINNLPRPTSLPVFADEQVLSARETAKKPHFTAPDPSQRGLPIRQPRQTLAGATMSSQPRNHICKCQKPFGTKGDLERHQKTACVLTKDKVQYTCLLHVGAPTCDRPCSNDSHNNECSPSCEYRPRFNDSRVALYQNRPDKMRYHLMDSHGWDRLPQGAIPKSWLWPVKRVPSTTSINQWVWACSLCDKELGTWEDGNERITDHCIDCANGAKARTRRYRRLSDGSLRALLTRRNVGSASLPDDDMMQEDDGTDEEGEGIVDEEFDDMGELWG
jgi:hypothetical protein